MAALARERAELRALSPGALAERVAALPVLIEGHSVETGSVPVDGYYGGRARPTGEISVTGCGQVGRGENVDWTSEEQARFARAVGDLVPGPSRSTTIGGLSASLLESDAHPHHRAAIEAAAIELALGQAGTDLFRLAGRPRREIRVCWSIGRETVEHDGPETAVDALLVLQPEARIKIDGPSTGWPEAAWGALAANGRIVVVDFKRVGSARQVALAHDHLPDAWLEAARRSPVRKMAMEWKVAFPLHPEYRTLPMVWYVPPLSPIQSAAEAGKIGMDNEMPDVRSLRIPLRYLANLLTAGKEEPVANALERMLAMRAYMRAKTIDGVIDEAVAARVGLTPAQIEDMYHIMAIANYEDRFVIPTSHREIGEDAYELRGSCGFSFGNGCSGGGSGSNLFGAPRKKK